MIKLETTESLPASLASDPRQTDKQNVRSISDFHCSNCVRQCRMPFALDIPSDGTPEFELYDEVRSDVPKGLGWRLNIQVLIAVPAVSSTSVGGRNLVRDKAGSEWDYTYTASDSLVPLEKVPRSSSSQNASKGGWLSYLMPSAFGFDGVSSDGETASLEADSVGYDEVLDAGDEDGKEARVFGVSGSGKQHWKGKGKEGQVVPDGLGNEHEWQQMRLELVECNVPLKVWPGNTAFRPHEVTFRL